MTHPSLLGYNEPKGVRRERLRKQRPLPQKVTPMDIDTITPLQIPSSEQIKTKRVRSYRDKCLRTLRNYRRYVSDNDVNLYHRWQKAMDGMNLIPEKWDEVNAIDYVQSNATLSRDNCCGVCTIIVRYSAKLSTMTYIIAVTIL